MEGFSSIASQLTRLTQKMVNFQCSNDCEKSFTELKIRLTTTPVFTLPVGSNCYVIYCDASRVGLGWFEIGEASLKGPYSVLYAVEKVQLIRDRLKTAQSCHKSYSAVRTRELEFQVDDWVFSKSLNYERGDEIWKEMEAQS